MRDHRVLPEVPRPLAWLLAIGLAVPALMALVLLFTGAFQAGRNVNLPPESISLWWIQEILSSLSWRRSLCDSLIIAASTTGIGLALGFPAAIGLRMAGRQTRYIVLSALLVPFFLPPLILAVGWYQPAHVLHLFDTYAGMALFHSSLAIPLVVLTLLQALDRLDLAFWQAASNAGATLFRSALDLALPAIWPAVLLSALFAFMVSFNEVAFSLYLTEVNIQPVVRGIWSGVRYEFSPEVFAVAFWILALDLFLFLLVYRMSRYILCQTLPER